MSDFLDSTAADLVGARQDIEQQRRQINENATREAFNSYALITTGVGDVTPAQPIMFEARFVQEPFLSTGVVMVKKPDLTRYRLPLVTAGVLRWVTEPLRPETPGKEVGAPGTAFIATSVPALSTGMAVERAPDLLNTPDPKKPVAYIGAYMYFTIFVDPIKRPRTDGSNLSALQSELTTSKPGSIAFKNLTQLVKEARQALDLLGHLPKTTLRHHLTFRGVAMKALHPSIEELAKTRTDLAPAGGTQ